MAALIHGPRVMDSLSSSRTIGRLLGLNSNIGLIKELVLFFLKQEPKTVALRGFKHLTIFEYLKRESKL
jgi:hypothetical protein